MSRRFIIPAGAALMLPAAAWAHPAAAAHEHGLEMGLLHPLTGLDHLMVMVAIGVWAVRARVREVWIAPASFLAGMTTALFAGFPFISAPAIELGVVLSILVLGLLFTFSMNLPRWATILLAVSAGLFHGMAHAAEGPIQLGSADFAVGVLMATLMLHAGGALMGLATARLHNNVLRIAGLTMTAFGLGAALSLA